MSLPFRLHLPFGKELYIVTDPEIALGILRDRTNDKPPHIKNTTIMSGGRLSIFSSPMHLNHWKVNRKCVAPAFAKSALAGKMTLLETKLAVFDALLAEHASSRTPADINELLINLTVNFIALSAFGYDLQTTPSTKGGPPSEGEQFLFHLRVVLREAFLKRLMNPLRKYMFWNAEVRQAERSSQWLLTFAIEIIRHYRDTHTERDIEADDSIIAHLLRNKQYPDDTSRAADVIIFLIGGHDTTSYTMAWLLYELAKNPDLQERLHLELLEAAKTGPLTSERLAQLPFFNRCLRESMRLWPVAGSAQRQLRAPLQAAGLTLPAGASVRIPFLTMFRSPCFKNPDSFLPDRWVNIAPELDEMVVPFSLGVRNCLGQNLANLELRVVLARMLVRFSFEVAVPPEPTYLLTLQPGGLMLKVSEYSPSVAILEQ